MKPAYDTIYLSPHLDDAALSCGGQIFAQTAAGKSVLIVTIMAGVPPEGDLSDFARSLHTRWGWELVTNAINTRRQEDVIACRVLGADFVHWTVPDCIYRRQPINNKLFYPTWDDAIHTIHPAEQALIDQLARQFTALPQHGQIVAPLAAGNHVDHQIVRQAAERGIETGLFYYEDYPYVKNQQALAAIMQSKDVDWQSKVIPLRDEDIAAKITAVATYASQLSSFFNGRFDLENQIGAYAQQVGGERLWYQS